MDAHGKTERRQQIENWSVAHPLVLFTGLAYGISWALWIPAGLFLTSWVAQAAHFAGAFGPMIAAMIVARLQGGSVISWILSLFKWRVEFKWYAFVLLFPAFLIAIMSALYLITGNMLDWHLLPERLSAYAPTLAYWLLWVAATKNPAGVDLRCRN